MRLFGIKFRYFFLGFLVTLALVCAGVLYQQSVQEKWKPTSDIMGSWSGVGRLSGTDEAFIEIQITIDQEGNVEGYFGEAKFTGGQFLLNRNDFERFIRVKTDYVISDGILEGSVWDHENAEDAQRETSMPITIEKATMEGTLFLIEGWKYPEPIILEIQLTRLSK
jgi:hypothetical protein